MEIKLKDQNGNVKKFADINFSQMLSILDNKLDENISYKLKINNIKAGKIEVFPNNFNMAEEDEIINIKNFWELIKKIKKYNENYKKYSELKIDFFLDNLRLKLKLNLNNFKVRFEHDCHSLILIVKFFYENTYLFKILINEESVIPRFNGSDCYYSEILINDAELL